jgi:ketosteroid isomerase-like protein
MCAGPATVAGYSLDSWNSLSGMRALPGSRVGRNADGMSNIAELEKKLNDAVLSGKALEAFEELYADDIVMQENLEPEYRGKDFNRKREQEFFASVEAWHDGRVLASAVHGDVSFSEWIMDITLKGVGRVTMAQVAVRRWKDGKIVHERFYHK